MKKYLFLGCLFCMIQMAFAQNQTGGTLKGKVVDENNNNEPVTFANVAVYKNSRVEGLELELIDGTYTDESGEYFISNLPDGLYLLEFTHIDFPTPFKLDKVKIETNKTIILDAKYPKINEGCFCCLGCYIDVTPPIINTSNTSNTTTIQADDIRRMGIR